MTTLVRVLATAILSTIVVATPLAALDASGTYKVTGEIASNDIDATLVLKQDGEALSGTIEFHGRAKPAAVRGTVRERAITIEFEVEADAGTYANTWTGTIAEDGGLAGTVDVASMATGSFKATRQ
jgi:hypothetical protein